MKHKWRITCISDTHTKQKVLDGLLPGGDILIHAGDFMNSGYNPMDATMFFKWFDEIDNYDTKVFISGNHDRWMQNKPEEVKGILTEYKTIEYLEDDLLILGEGEYIDMIKIWGTPWQPEFFNWAFNVPRGEQIKEKWDKIPVNTDVLIVHGPPYGKLDYVPSSRENVGCDELLKKIDEIKPKIVVCGHIHEGRGMVNHNGTLIINASILNDRYEFRYKPLTFDFDFTTGEWEVVEF